MVDLAGLQKTLGVSFKDLSLLEQALVHSSYINENPHLAPVSNERLEFLGDAVLGLIVAERLYRGYSGLNEGDMTRLRAALVRQETLSRIAGGCKLGDYLYMGKGEEAGGGRLKAANLASALEAVIAAVFLDLGYLDTRVFVFKLLEAELAKAVGRGKPADYKSELQHLTQSRQQEAPGYQVIEATGPEHGRTFTVEVRLGEIVLGRGSGKSKKSAETDAARSALERLSTGFTQ